MKLRLFSHFSVILTIIKNKWLTSNSQYAILNNFEEYYNYRWLLNFTSRFLELTNFDMHIRSSILKFYHIDRITITRVECSSKCIVKTVVSQEWNIYPLDVFTEKPYSKLLERNVGYIPITTSRHVTSVTSK